MEKHLYYYPNHTAFESSTSLKNIHNVVYCDNETHVHYDYNIYKESYFTVEIVEAGTVTLQATELRKTIEYSTDNGSTWTSLTTSTTTALPLGGTLNVGDKILIRGNNAAYSSSTSNGNKFGGTAKVNIYGNIMSLINGSDFLNSSTISESYTFCNLFMDYVNLLSAENLVLPNNTTSYCFRGMFRGCTSLTKAPKLPAFQLALSCYDGMFFGCTSLVQAPDLLAPTLVTNCYSNMFTGCSLLNYVKCLTTTRVSNSTTNWLRNVAASGTFIKEASMEDWTTGTSGIPSGWTVQNASN